MQLVKLGKTWSGAPPTGSCRNNTLSFYLERGYRHRGKINTFRVRSETVFDYGL